jgi:hypothetical protein
MDGERGMLPTTRGWGDDTSSEPSALALVPNIAHHEVAVIQVEMAETPTKVIFARDIHAVNAPR